jgi:hypothetical protein
VDVQTVRRRLICRFGGEDERHRRQYASVIMRGIHCPTSLVVQQLGPVQRRYGVGERMCGRLIHPDRLTERLAHDRVAGADSDGLGGQPHQVRGQILMSGICKQERHDAFTADGWYDTGDRGFFDAAGHLHFTGRASALIKTAGSNI